jgi:hypothetical protein
MRKNAARPPTNSSRIKLRKRDVNPFPPASPPKPNCTLILCCPHLNPLPAGEGTKKLSQKEPSPGGRGKTVRALNLAPMPSKGENSGVSEIVAHGTSHSSSPSAHRRHMYRSGFAVGGTRSSRRQFGPTTALDPGLTSPRLHVIPGDEAPWARRQQTSSAIYLAGGLYHFSSNPR